jgi:preprotein translocase subunit SecD
MLKNLRWKWLFIMATVVACILVVTGVPTSKQQLLENISNNVRLGLDLKGGSHLVLQVQVQDAFKSEADQLIEQLQPLLQKEGITYQSIDRNDPNSIEAAETIAIEVRGVAPAREGDLSRIVNSVSTDKWMLQRVGTDGYRLQMRKSAALALRQDTLSKTIETLDRKVNALGVAEASVQQRGGMDGAAEVLVQLPGVDDPVRVRGILQTAAMLELTEVKGGPFSSREEALGANGGVLPLNTKLVQGSARTGSGSWWLLARSPVVTGRDLRDARAQAGEGGFGWETNFVLTQDAAARFHRFTGANVGRQLAIVFDNVVLSAPRIDSAISDQGRITGASSHEEAADLALNLRAGALPAGIKVIEERIVGPSLGADSIRRGVTAGLVGLALVIASMILYYRGAGLNAVVALLLNSMITVAALSYIDATWTLPGIAGLVLSIGMAVDSNVLIFERIKEELQGGKGVPTAINSGFQRAFVTIVDTHVTTVVASLFLFLFGTGPVRGFAVTLVIGLLANLFTAVFVSRAIFDWQIFRNPRLNSLSIWPRKGGELFATPNIAFMNKRALTLGISALAVAASIALLATKGVEYGLDFRGGTLTYVRFEPAPSIDELRQTVSAEIEGEISVQQVQGSGGEFIIGSEIADEQELDRKRQGIREALERKYGQTASGKIDLNNSPAGALAEAFQAAGGSRTPALSPDQWTDVASRILAYRDRDASGIVRNFDDLRRVEGVTPDVLEVVKAQTYLSPFNIRSVEMVGPRAGEQMRRQALMATVGAFVGMLAYIAWRFRMVAGVAAVIATIHDVLITVGLFALTGREINLNVIAALLTLIGYSMNDKIVVFDRVRENEQSKRSKGSFPDLVNQSINQTLSRTLLTAGPTLLACLALYFLGGEVLNGIAFALIAGILVGTYSSIFVASALLVFWRERMSRRSRQMTAPSAGTTAPAAALRKP